MVRGPQAGGRCARCELAIDLDAGAAAVRGARMKRHSRNAATPSAARPAIHSSACTPKANSADPAKAPASSGAASGTGALHDTGLDLPPNAVATYLVTVIVPTPFTGNLANPATITPIPKIDHLLV